MPCVNCSLSAAPQSAGRPDAMSNSIMPGTQWSAACWGTIAPCSATSSRYGPMVEPMSSPSVLLVLHDVAPQTWADYQPFVEAVDALGNVPMTWLVVPDFHKHNALDAHPGFRSLLTRRIALSDELALHGYFHCDDSPIPFNPLD